ncbi:MAG TPA: glycoside hydrolase family 57 protein [Candidatus Nanoarchaeia archaeon]|nr:glycoside hydrolase family 57 protein [Candidatus Nanoarchaeia archaeon]
MVSVCFYFQVHQPYRLRNYSVFDIGNSRAYFDESKNSEILGRIAKKCYIPANSLIKQLIEEIPNFKVSYSFSGVLLDQLQEKFPGVINSFQQLVDTGNVELLDETYHHSLSFLYSKKEFDRQIKEHHKKMRQMFKVKPKVFRNTELVYSNELAKHVQELGYSGILAEGADKILGWRSPNFLYTPVSAKNVSLLLKNYRLSDDIAFRFSERSWNEWPLTAEKFSNWVSAYNGNGNCVNLFMDYETIGEHQWEETGIFHFLKKLPEEILKHPDNDFKTPSELIKTYKPVAELDVPDVVSWADVERDVSAWVGNSMQQSAIKKVYDMEQEVVQSSDLQLIEDWRKLQISDHFYYMCTKWFNDGDVHKYFNPYDSPYDAFISFMNIVNDLELRLKKR